MPSTSPVGSALPAGADVGNYRIEGLLGRGAMGEVYAARDRRTDQLVALKIVRPGQLDGLRQRRKLYAEGWVAAGLDHPNICTIYEVGDAEGRAFVAMEFVSGTTLDVFARETPFDADRALDIAIQLTRALHEAHSRHVVHRDLKSTNIVVTAEGVVKVLDFGLAIRTDAEAATFEPGAPRNAPSGVGVGTADYASPEQILGAALDARSDLFSLGVVLHEMLTGRLPFSGENRTELFRAIVNNPARPADQLNGAVPLALSNVVGRLLAKQREERYQSAEDVLRDLERIGDEATRPPRMRHLTDSRWFHRIAGTAAGLILAVGGLFPASVVVSYEAEAALRSTAARQSGVWTGLAGGRTLDEVVAAAERPDSVWIGNDGRLVYSTSGQNGRGAIWTLAPGDLSPRLVTADARQPTVLPAGNAVVFTGIHDQALYRSALDGSRLERLTAEPATSPRVMPDGTAIVFRHAVTGRIWMLPLDGSPARPLTDRRIDATAPLVSPDGRRLAFEQAGQTLVCDLPGCVNERRLPIAGVRAWTPDSLALAYAGQPRQANVWIAPVEGGPSKQITWFSRRAVSSVAWSPDGRRLAVARKMTLSDLELLAPFR
jgi:hypothetical protein